MTSCSSQLRMPCGRSSSTMHRRRRLRWRLQRRVTPVCLLLVILMISTSSTHFIFLVQGRKLIRAVDDDHPYSHQLGVVKEEDIVEEEKREIMMRGQIGSRPPRCERRCSGCGHCEAIQVPTNPQIKNNNTHNNSAAATTAVVAAAGAAILSSSSSLSPQDYSNYKPMSWKCKCGNFIFNP